MMFCDRECQTLTTVIMIICLKGLIRREEGEKMGWRWRGVRDGRGRGGGGGGEGEVEGRGGGGGGGGLLGNR